MTFEEWLETRKAKDLMLCIAAPGVELGDVADFGRDAWHARDAEISELNLTISTLREQLASRIVIEEE